MFYVLALIWNVFTCLSSGFHVVYCEAAVLLLSSCFSHDCFYFFDSASASLLQSEGWKAAAAALEDFSRTGNLFRRGCCRLNPAFSDCLKNFSCHVRLNTALRWTLKAIAVSTNEKSCCLSTSAKNPAVVAVSNVFWTFLGHSFRAGTVCCIRTLHSI